LGIKNFFGTTFAFKTQKFVLEVRTTQQIARQALSLNSSFTLHK